MCGIIGYVGKENASGLLLDCLKNLEYRGYDSCGMATIFDGELFVRKDVGRIEDVHKRLNFTELKGTIGMAHTRWATHGAVTRENGHPQVDCAGMVAVVHNGIIENYHELGRDLLERGHVFRSETDTEVIPHLIEDEIKNGKSFIMACANALRKLEGIYAVLVLKKDEKKIVATRKGAPLVIGVADDAYFAASDIPAFLQHTKSVVYLHDDDLAVLDSKPQFFSLKNGSLEEVTRPVHTVDWSIEQVQKGDFDHFMMKEISEQVESVQKATNQDKAALLEVAETVKEAKDIFLVACGSSYHACLSASYIFAKIANIHLDVILASEFSNYEHFLAPDTLVIAVSQSGETIDVLDAVKTARRKNSKIICIVNVMGSSLHRSSDQALMLNTGPEICVLSTKTYTAQLAVLSLLAYTVADKYEEGKASLRYLWNITYNLTSANTRNYVRQLADMLKDKEHIFTIGRGLHYPTALEAALKIKEVSYIHAEGFSGGELKHGAIALIDDHTPCIVFYSAENERETISNAREIKARGGYLIGIGPENNEVFDFFIKVPEVGELNSICQIIPIQILAYQLAVLRGCDPDKPRNLAKSVTVR